MLCQHISDDCNRSAYAFREFVLAEAMVHCGDNALPEFIAAFLMNRFIAHNGELMNTRRDKNEHRITLARLVHSEPMKFLLRRI